MVRDIAPLAKLSEALDHHAVYFSDRKAQVSTKKKGGGVILIKERGRGGGEREGNRKEKPKIST